MICRKCGDEKDIIYFSRHYGHYESLCLECKRKLGKKYHRSKIGFLKNTYNKIQWRLKKQRTYKNRKLLFSFDEFYKFSIYNEGFLSIRNKYINSHYNRKYTPTVDRINNDGDYSLDNIQFLTLSDNVKKDYHSSGHIKAAKLLCVELNKTFPSVLIASKELSVLPTSIYHAAKHNKRLLGYHFKMIK